MISVDPSWTPTPIQIHIRPPDGSDHPVGGFAIEPVQKEIDAARENKVPITTFIFQAIAQPFPILSEGRLMVVAVLGDQEIPCCFLNAILEPKASSTASPQPASQSQPAA
jgi:hypothetical protein